MQIKYIICALLYIFSFMPQSPQNQILRQETIRELLLSDSASTQKSLVEQLNKKGFAVTQSSVSRDLREIGAVKSNHGYSLVSSVKVNSEVQNNVLGLIKNIQEVGTNLLVIKTAIGSAQQVALYLDNSDWSEIVGNIGGDDTVFTAVPNKTAQRTLQNKISYLASSSR